MQCSKNFVGCSDTKTPPVATPLVRIHLLHAILTCGAFLQNFGGMQKGQPKEQCRAVNFQLACTCCRAIFVWQTSNILSNKSALQIE